MNYSFTYAVNINFRLRKYEKSFCNLLNFIIKMSTHRQNDMILLQKCKEAILVENEERMSVSFEQALTYFVGGTIPLSQPWQQPYETDRSDSLETRY